MLKVASPSGSFGLGEHEVRRGRKKRDDKGEVRVDDFAHALIAFAFAELEASTRGVCHDVAANWLRWVRLKHGA